MIQMVDGRIFEGRYIFFAKPVEVSEVECPRCGKRHMMVVCVGGEDKRKVCFCLNPDCLQRDAEVSKKIARLDAHKKLEAQQVEARKEMLGRSVSDESVAKSAKVAAKGAPHNHWSNDF